MNASFPVVPSPYPGEHYFGVCCRLLARSGCGASTAFRRNFVKDQRGDASWSQRRVPSHMGHVAHLLSMDVEQLALCHTPLPYYESCAPRPLTQRRLHEVIGDDEACLRRYINNAWKRNPLRWCCACVRQDIKELGEPLWYVAHQLPGVWVCLRHNAWLCSACPTCGWSPRMAWVLEYPATHCPQGHRLWSCRPSGVDALSLTSELALAQWSGELIAWRPPSITRALGDALREVALRAGLMQRRGWNFEVIDTPGVQRNLRRHAVLRHWAILLGRVTRAQMSSPAEVVRCVVARRKVHPLAVVLCVKALTSPCTEVLESLRQGEPADVGESTWATRWYAADRFATAEHVALMHSLIESERGALATLRWSQAVDLLAARMSLSSGSIHVWLGRHPVLRVALQQARQRSSEAP